MAILRAGLRDAASESPSYCAIPVKTPVSSNSASSYDTSSSHKERGLSLERKLLLTQRSPPFVMVARP